MGRAVKDIATRRRSQVGGRVDPGSAKDEEVMTVARSEATSRRVGVATRSYEGTSEHGLWQPLSDKSARGLGKTSHVKPWRDRRGLNEGGEQVTQRCHRGCLSTPSLRTRVAVYRQTATRMLS